MELSEDFENVPLKYVYLGRKLSRNEFYRADRAKETLTEIAFGRNITEIPSYIMNFSNLETISLLNPTPPSVSSSYFTNAQYLNLNVYVPKGSLEVYQQADVWKNFWGLQEKDFTGIETVETDDNRTDAVIFDMQGRRLDAPQNGLNIINGKKVMIKK